MSLGQFILRHLFAKREEERMRFREAVNITSAHAEDLKRTIQRNKNVICEAIHGQRKSNGSGR